MDREGRQALHYRAVDGDVSGIRDRLAAGDDVGLADRQGFTALHFAAQQSQAEAVTALLEAGAPVDPEDQRLHIFWRGMDHDPVVYAPER